MIRVAPTYIHDDETGLWALPISEANAYFAEDLMPQQDMERRNRMWLCGFIAGAVWTTIFYGLIWLLGRLL